MLLDKPRILAVDLDGTLVHTDTLVESVLTLLRQQPLAIGLLVLALARGRAGFKAWVAHRVSLDVASLPFNTQLLEWLRRERDDGRQLVLVTAADVSIVDAVADHTGLFNSVLASDGARNLKAGTKADTLVKNYGQGGFDYAGNSAADIPVWCVSREAVVVGGEKIQQSAARVAPVGKVFTTATPYPAALRALRLHRWLENLLIFLPWLLTHRTTDTLAAAGSAFIAFGLTGSAVYLLDDLRKLPADRQDPMQFRRPFASGDLPVLWGMILIPLLLAAGAIPGLLMQAPLFLLVLAGYAMLGAAYLFKLKRKAVAGALAVAGLYALRVVAGVICIS
jgi:phosphoserine phosphatase